MIALVVREPDRAPADGAASIELAFSGHSSSSSVALGAPVGEGVQVDTAYLSLEDLRFRPADACDRIARASIIEGRVVAELVTRRTIGLEEAVTLPRTRYCSLDVPFRPDDGSSGVAAVRGSAILVEGRRADGVPFVIRSRRRDVVRLHALDSKGLLLRGHARLVVVTDIGRWLDGIDLSALVPSRGRKSVIRIDESSHRGLLRRFESNVRTSLVLCRAVDGSLSLEGCPPDRELARAR